MIAASTAVLLTGCVLGLGEGRAKDTMTIFNGTDAPITVTYEAVTNGRVISTPVIVLGSDASSYVSPGHFGSLRCLRGEFVARSAGELVDRLPQPCKEQVWEVAGP